MANEPGVSIRTFTPEDAAPLTDLLHAAYGRLADLGLNFTAVDQTPQTTLYRASAGRCLVAELDGAMVGTVTFSMPPSAPLVAMWPAACRPGTVWLNQLAVAPERQGLGIARTLFDAGIAWSRAQGATTMGLDTAAPATHLVELYNRWGFTERGSVQWEGKTYLSVIMTRPI